MSLLDSVKGKYKEEQQKRAQVSEQRGKRLGHIKVQYIGGYDNKKRPDSDLLFFEGQVEYRLGLSGKGFVISSSGIETIDIEGKDQFRQRITLTRMLTIGGIFLPKKIAIKEAYITLKLKDGREVVFYDKESSPAEVKSKLINAISLYGQSRVSQAASPQAGTTDAASQLEHFAELRQKGVITQEEFENKKAQLLGQ